MVRPSEAALLPWVHTSTAPPRWGSILLETRLGAAKLPTALVAVRAQGTTLVCSAGLVFFLN